MHTRVRSGILGAAATTRAMTLAMIAAAAPALSVTAASAQQAVVLVRHAEKADQTADSPLSPEGQARAKALADLLRGSGITHVITSEYLRTRQTAAPLAAALGLTIEQVPARDRQALLAKLASLDPASIVLVVGHSNTIPALLTALGSSAAVQLEEGHYDDVFVLAPRPDRQAAMVRLKYGRPTP